MWHSVFLQRLLQLLNWLFERNERRSTPSGLTYTRHNSTCLPANTARTRAPQTIDNITSYELAWADWYEHITAKATQWPVIMTIIRKSSFYIYSRKSKFLPILNLSCMPGKRHDQNICQNYCNLSSHCSHDVAQGSHDRLLHTGYCGRDGKHPVLLVRMWYGAAACRLNGGLLLCVYCHMQIYN